MNWLDIAVKIFKDFLSAYGYMLAAVIFTLVARYIGAHVKNARLKVVAGLAEDAIASQINLNKTGAEKKAAATALLSDTVKNNLWGVNITPQEIDMRLEGAYQRIMNSKPEETNKVIDNVVDTLTNKESEK